MMDLIDVWFKNQILVLKNWMHLHQFIRNFFLKLKEIRLIVVNAKQVNL